MVRPDAGRSRLARPGEWLSTHYPFVWRTRAWFFVVAGLSAAAASGAYALSMGVRRETLEDLTSSLFVLSTWSFVGYGAALLVVIDVARRARPIVGLKESVRVFGCAAVSILALTLPEYAYIKGYVPRIASLESDATLANIMATHGPHDFWQCLPDGPVVSARKDRIADDLERYGLITDFSTGYDYRDCRGLSGEYSMNEWPTRSPMYPYTGRPGLFRNRVMNVDAAKKYARHDGAYEGVAMGHVWAIVWTSVAGGLLTALLSSAMMWRWWTAISGRRWSIGGWMKWMRVGRSRLAARVDERLAARLPAVWSARLPGSALQLLAAPALIFFFAVMNSTDYEVTWIMFPAIVIAIFVACRTQDVARYRPTRARLDVAVLLIHATVLFTAAAAVYWFRPRLGLDKGELTLTLWGIIVWCSFLQAARNGSLTAFGALALIGAVAFGYTTLYQLADKPMTDQAVLGGAIVTMALLMLMFGFADRIEARPAVRRLLVAAVIAFSPVPVLVAALVIVMPRASEITFIRMIISALIAFGSTSLFLVITGRARRRLSYSAR